MGEKGVCFGERRGRFGEMSGCVVERRRGVSWAGRWGAAVAGVRGEGWFRFDSAKVGLCLGRGPMSETLHDEEPKVGARALQGWDFARGGAQKARFAGGRIGLFGGNDVERRDGRDSARGVFFG